MADSPAEALERIRTSAPGSLSRADCMRLGRALSKGDDLPLEPLRLVSLSSYTTEFLDPFLVVEGARYGYRVDVFRGGFGQFEQALLGKEWQGDGEERLVLVAAMRLEDLDSDIPFRFFRDGGEAFDEVAESALTRLRDTLAIFRGSTSAPALVANFSVPEPRPLAVFDAGAQGSLSRRVQDLNQGLLEVVAGIDGAHVWDYAGLVAARGSGTWTDPRMWSLARTPVAAAHQPALAAHLMRAVRGVTRPSAKCLVLDLDNTLWGGAIGDEGVKGIALGDDFPGRAFKDFQRAVLGLRDRGIVLAIASKNDAEVVERALRDHPEMLVSPDDFAAARVNWGPKSVSLREIARELNIGIDSLVFFDDNPVERAEVRAHVPEVEVVEVPTDPVEYVQALASVALFDMPSLTAEDRSRASSYQASKLRSEAMESAGSMEDFLQSLEMTIEIGSVEDLTIARVAQLVGKTNQFNLTTKRYTEAEIREMAERDDHLVRWLRLRDRYGDMGLICVAILRIDGETADVDSLILSCRAANRGIEQAMVSDLVERAREHGCRELTGSYLPTERNHVVAGLYAGLGFEVAEGEAGASTARLELTGEGVEMPTFLSVVEDLTAVGGDA